MSFQGTVAMSWTLLQPCLLRLLGALLPVAKHDSKKRNTPAEVQEGPAGLWHVLVQPGQEVELGDSSRLVGLHVLQVEASDQEVVTPDMFRHQVHLPGHERERGSTVGGAKPVWPWRSFTS